MDMLLAAERVHGGGGGGRQWARERARRRQRSWGFIQELIENGRRSRLTQTAASGSMKKNNDTSHERTTRIFPLTRKPLSLRVRPDTCQAETQVLEAREQLLDLERPSASASAKRPGARRPARGRHMGTYGFRTCGRERRFSDWSPTRLAPGPGDPRETGGAREPREPRRRGLGPGASLLTRRDHRTSEAEEERTTLEALRENITLSFEDSHMYERSRGLRSTPNAMLKLTQTHVPGSPRQTIRYRQRELHF